MPDALPSPEKDGSPRGACPVCGRPPEPRLRPFCSKRCADVDLHRWLSGGYRIESEDEPDEPSSDVERPG